MNIPTSLRDIKLKDYQRFAKVAGNDEFLSRKMVQIFCGVDDPLKIKKNDLERAYNALTDVFSERPDLVRTFNLNGVSYGFIPSLEDMTMGEFIDLDNYIGDWQTIDKAMQVLYRPIVSQVGKNYRIEEYKGTDTGGDFSELSMDIVLSAQVFFYRLGESITRNILTSLGKETNVEMVDSTTGEAFSQEDGDGIRLLTLWQEEIFSNTIELLNSPTSNALSMLSSEGIKQMSNSAK